MALIRRDYAAIGKAGRDFLDLISMLKIAHNKLVQDINSIRENYQGIDAEALINVLLERANKINEIINLFNHYAKYMIYVNDYDNENTSNVRKQVNSVRNGGGRHE